MLVLVALLVPGLLAARPRQLGYSYELDTPGAGVRYRGDISGVVGPSIPLPSLNMPSVNMPSLNMPSVTNMVRPILRNSFNGFHITFIMVDHGRDSKGISSQNCHSEFTSKILGPP